MVIKAALIFLIISSVGYSQEILRDVGVAEVGAVGRKTLSNIASIKNYQFILVKREYIDGRDTGYQYIQVKVQTEPLKVYLKFLKPARLVGREALFIDGELTVRRGGSGALKELVVHLKPSSPLAMDGNKYPITHINPSQMCKSLLGKINTELKFKDTRIYKKAGAAIYKQPGVHYRLIHTVEEPGMQCMMAEMIISTELGIPIYFKVMGWNRKVLEEYAFQDMKINVEFGPNEFDEENPEYGFAKDD